MEVPPRPASAQTSLFQVYLRLRPPLQAPQQQSERWLIVEPPSPTTDTFETEHDGPSSTHITLQPPNDSRKRAVEKFAFTKIFEEGASQLDVFQETGMPQLVRGVLAEGRDGLVATLGVTGSGKSHTILGSRTQRGITQMTLDVLFRSLSSSLNRPDHNDTSNHNLISSLASSDPSEAQVSSAQQFLESIYGDLDRGRASRAQTPMVGTNSRAQTPMTVWQPSQSIPGSFPLSPPPVLSDPALGTYPKLNPTVGINSPPPKTEEIAPPTIGVIHSPPSAKVAKKFLTPSHFLPSEHPFRDARERITRKVAKAKSGNAKETTPSWNVPRKHLPHRPSALPQVPDVSEFAMHVDENAEYAVLVSMYEVYNDRIFDLLSSPLPTNASQMSTRQGMALQKDLRRRPLLFKSTEGSPDRKVVAGLKKVVCGTFEEAMMVLETGLVERRVAGTGSNSASSRSHGFFCVEVRKKHQSRAHGSETWTGSTLTVVDLAGSERARNAKTAGATLAEAGKINESLMYLGQCLQMQSDQDGAKPSLVPFRQCKLTELLFSNSFTTNTSTSHAHKTPQKAVMIVTADPLGDFNATSQILRYSALAREVTVPRIPSTTSEILAGSIHKAGFSFVNGRSSPSHTMLSEELESAATEIARLSDECDTLSVRLTEEEIGRAEAEVRCLAAEDRCLNVEQEVREDCWAEMEGRMESEMRRWKEAWQGEKMEAEEHLDRKLEILTRGVTIHEDVPPDHQRAEDLERENEVLRSRIASLERESHLRSPTKSKKTTTTTSTTTKQQPNSSILQIRPPSLENATAAVEKTVLKLESCSLDEGTWTMKTTTTNSTMMSPAKTPGTGTKKIRKLTTRKWDLAGEDELNDSFA